MTEKHTPRSRPGQTRFAACRALLSILLCSLLVAWTIQSAPEIALAAPEKSLAAPEKSLAIPPLPCSLYGSVRLDGQQVPAGATIEALIEEQVVASTQTLTYQGDSVYALDIPGDDPGSASVEGGHEGELLHFKINGVLAEQTAQWHSATNLRLDLSAPRVSLPTATPTATQPLATQPVAATGATPAPGSPTQVVVDDSPTSLALPTAPGAPLPASPAGTAAPVATSPSEATPPLLAAVSLTGQDNLAPANAPPSSPQAPATQALLPNTEPPLATPSSAAAGVSPPRSGGRAAITLASAAGIVTLAVLGAWYLHRRRPPGPGQPG